MANRLFQSRDKSGSLFTSCVVIHPEVCDENHWQGQIDLALIPPQGSSASEYEIVLFFDVKGSIITAEEGELYECCFRFNYLTGEGGVFTRPAMGSPLWVGNEYYDSKIEPDEPKGQTVLRLIAMRILLYSIGNYEKKRVRQAVLHAKRFDTPILSGISADFERVPHTGGNITLAFWGAILTGIDYDQSVQALTMTSIY